MLAKSSKISINIRWYFIFESFNHVFSLEEHITLLNIQTLVNIKFVFVELIWFSTDDNQNVAAPL